MSGVWSSLYLRTHDAPAVARALESAAVEQGYTRFDPFSGGPGRAWPQAVRLFVGPAQGGWVRVLGEPDPALLPTLSRLAPLLWVTLQNEQGHLEAWAHGEAGTIDSVFGLTGQPVSGSASVPKMQTGVVDLLPDDLKAMNAHPKQAEAMIQRLSGGLLKKAGGDQAKVLAALQGQPPRWDSPGGRHIASTLDALGVPDWFAPDYVALREAYALRLRLERRPQATLFAGDQTLMDAVPQALEYQPVYAGKASRA